LNALLAVESALGISEANANQISVFPNPVENNLQFQSNVSLVEIQFVDTLSRLIDSHTDANGIRMHDVSNLTKGLYFVTVLSENATSKTFKILKK
tara:strand:+ start:1275 stop:1559 length:285 start_codon:yes stop_codon:yes gene_type:complete